VATGICAALLLLAAPLALPSGSRGDSLRVFVAQDRFARDEARIVNLHQDIAKAYDARQLTADKAAERLEIEVLGPWEQAMQPILDIPPIRPATSQAARQRELLQSYVRERKTAYELTIVTLRHPGAEAAANSTAAWQRVDALIKRLQAESGSP